MSENVFAGTTWQFREVGIDMSFFALRAGFGADHSWFNRANFARCPAPRYAATVSVHHAPRGARNHPSHRQGETAPN
jgi:hypothetical protein